MDEIIKDLKYGRCNENFCPKKLNDKDKIIYKNILNVVRNTRSINRNNLYNWYKNELELVVSFQKLIKHYPSYNYHPIFGLKNHSQLSLIEDSGFDTFRIYIKYINGKYRMMINLDHLIKIEKTHKNLILHLKEHLNMPRPYQLLLYYPDIKLKVESSISASTGSAPSGHCFSGLMIGYLIYISQKDFFDNNLYELNRLVCISLDLGYHRNMNGIHFVYDNFVSYITFKEVIHVYKYDNNNYFLDDLKKVLDKLFEAYINK
jgi:hypothetical protein